MSPRTRRAARPVLLAVLGGALSLGGTQFAAPAGAAPAAVASCRAAGGVYVYTGSSGNGGCSHQLSSSLDALRSIASVDFDNSGIICRIDAQPATCPAKADANNFWHYWWWNGHGWTFATLGPASHQPTAGSVEAWTFGGDAAPSWTPPAASAAPRHPAVPVPSSHATHTHEPAAPVTTTPETTTPETMAPAPKASATTLRPGQHPTQRSTNQQSPGGPATTASSARPTASAASATSASGSASPSASGTDSPSATPSAVSDSAPAAHHSRPSGLLYGIILLVACGVGIVVSARRRRR